MDVSHRSATEGNSDWNECILVRLKLCIYSLEYLIALQLKCSGGKSILPATWALTKIM